MAAPATTRSEDGWTLVELLVVLSLIMILASVAMSGYRTPVRAAKEAALKADLFVMHDAIDQYYADRGEYPESLHALVSAGYLRAIPVDPLTRVPDWDTIPADAEPGRLTSRIGIYAVKSRADGTALDGTRYSDW